MLWSGGPFDSCAVGGWHALSTDEAPGLGRLSGTGRSGNKNRRAKNIRLAVSQGAFQAITH